jgi:hypothetical protein
MQEMCVLFLRFGLLRGLLQVFSKHYTKYYSKFVSFQHKSEIMPNSPEVNFFLMMYLI